MEAEWRLSYISSQRFIHPQAHVTFLSQPYLSPDQRSHFGRQNTDSHHGGHKEEKPNTGKGSCGPVESILLHGSVFFKQACPWAS